MADQVGKPQDIADLATQLLNLAQQQAASSYSPWAESRRGLTPEETENYNSQDEQLALVNALNSIGSAMQAIGMALLQANQLAYAQLQMQTSPLPPSGLLLPRI